MSSSSNNTDSKNSSSGKLKEDKIIQHETRELIPSFDSAPPSGNFDPFSLSLPPPPPPPPPRIQVPVSARSTTPPRSNRSADAYLNAAVAEDLLPPPPRIATPPRGRLANSSPSPSSSPSTTASTEMMMEQAPTPQQQETSSDSFGPPPPLPVTTFAPPGPQVLARRQTHIPILVIATEAANQLAWKNNLQLTDLFQGIVHDLRIGQMPPFRSITKSIIPSALLVRFVTRLDDYDYASAHALLQDNARLQDADGNVAQELILLEDRVDELLQDRKKDEALEDVTKDAYILTSPLDIPWLLRYRHALDESTNFLPHDLINCPPMILTVCTTHEIESPLDVLQELNNAPHVLPDPFKNGLYDPNAVRHEVLVLHDSVDGPKDLEEVHLRQTLQQRFGPNSALIRVNSVLPETAQALSEQEDTDLWGGKGKKGNCLSVNDRVLLRRYFQTLLTTSLLPALERRVADLNAIVSERKKGVRNLVKSFWRKPKEETTGGSNESTDPKVKYRYDSIESQTRLLADTLFLMQDYEAAVSTYRLIRDDYKSDKALLHYANVHEMMALCLYHMDPYLRAKEIFTHLETALLSYTRTAEEERSNWGNDPAARPSTAPHSTRLATRLCLLLATASESLTKSRELEVADLLASASSHESSLGAAVLLEQSSAFYYHAGMYRKYAFHMLMSGHMFRTAGQDDHAFRCFTSALYVYRHGEWHELHNHLRSALAAQLYTMGRMSVALILYARLVCTSSGGKVSSKSQQKFLNHLLEICSEHPKAALAGADRMASPPSLPSNEREAFRNAQLERIVNVIRFSKGASRVLELPYMNLPQVVDSSVKIWTHAENHFIKEKEEQDEMTAVEQVMSVQFGISLKGQDETWEELQMLATAEMHASDSTKPKLDDSVTAALSKIKDIDHRMVIAQLDKERANRNILERNRRNHSIKPTPKVRTRGEPLFCDFILCNPLSIDIEISELQLVARMVDQENRVCTNQDAIRIRTKDDDKVKTWTFPSSGDVEFSLAEFCRVSEANTKSCSSARENPFFVVTKQDLVMSAGEETVISAGLTPLVTGSLEILGVRCKLSKQVWIYHPFKILGPLLNNNRTNRANRVRAESMVLKSTIEMDMPCLTAELVKRKSNELSTHIAENVSLLEGQISLWTIRLRNVGNAPAANVTLKTNLPWVNVKTKKDKSLPIEQLEAQSTSGCLGPTGTLVSLPLQGDQLSESGAIHPGESIDIPIEVRTSGHGKLHFYMLYRYELKDDPSSRHRWLRKMYEVQVYPSLALSARIGTLWWNGSEQLLSVELTNNRADRPTDLYITLDKLCLASRHYRLEILPGQVTTNEQVGNVLQIGWQERLTVHYRIVPLGMENKACLLSECAFTDSGGNSTKDCAVSDAMDYLCLEHANEMFEIAWKSHQMEIARAEHAQDDERQHPRTIASIRRANTTESSDFPSIQDDETLHPTSIGKLCPPGASPSKVHLMCSWRAIIGDEVIHGEHHLRGVFIRPLSFFNGCPIATTASHPSTISHDFSNGPAVVPIKLALRNRMLESPVKFYVTVNQSQSVELIGLDTLKLTLDASADITVPFEALISSPGVHNLQSLQLIIRKDMEEHSYRLQQQWLVAVYDTSISA